MELTYGLWVYNLQAGTSQKILEEIPASFAWKPGTHLLAYGLGVPEAYFPLGGSMPDAALARGVMGFDADTGATTELVKPERGYALYSIQWSPDGRYLGFDELVYYEGRGWFGYYDFEAGTYVPWEEQLGNYVWDADGTQILYDRMIYTPTGTEDIFARPLEANDVKRLTDYTAEAEYAFSPVLSPLGDRIAYLTNLEGPDSQNYSLQIQDLAGGEATSLGSFVSMSNLAWSPDGQWLLFSAGAWEDRRLFALNVSTGKATVLGAGTMLDVAGS
jgi:Tol biopolymer transport system component